MRWMVVAVAFGLAACSPEPKPAEAELSEVNVSEMMARDAIVAEERAQAPADPMLVDAEPSPEPPASEPPDLCWQDYCPCDPPQGGPDKGICRQLRAGLPVDDQMMSAAAMMRDARQQMDDFEAEYGEF